MVDSFDNIVFFSSLLIFISALSLVFVYDYFFLNSSKNKNNPDSNIQSSPAKQKFRSKS